MHQRTCASEESDEAFISTTYAQVNWLGTPSTAATTVQENRIAFSYLGLNTIFSEGRRGRTMTLVDLSTYRPII